MLYRQQVTRQLLTINEASIESGLPVSVIRRMTADPLFACLTINDGGRLFISRNAVTEQIERMKNKSVPADEHTIDTHNDMVDAHWNWNVPNIKHLSVDELMIFLGISRNTAYDLVSHNDFPVYRPYKNIFIPTSDLTKWLNNRAIRFHGLRRYNGLRKN